MKSGKNGSMHPWLLELNGDDRALARRVCQLIEQVQANETEIESIQRKSAVTVVEKQELEKKLEALTGSKDKMMVLYTALQKRNEELREESKSQTLEEKARRAELSDSFNITIGEITSRMDKDTQDRIQVLSRNEALKQDLKEHEEHIQNFLKTYEAQYTSLETEHRMLEMKMTFLKERFEKDSELLPDLEVQVAAAKEIDETLKTELNALTSSFEKLQKEISDSTTWFHKHQSEIDRLTKRMKIVETERIDAQKKMQKAQKELNDLLSEKSDAEKQLASIEGASATLGKLAEDLKAELIQLREKAKKNQHKDPTQDTK